MKEPAADLKLAAIRLGGAVGKIAPALERVCERAKILIDAIGDAAEQVEHGLILEPRAIAEMRRRAEQFRNSVVQLDEASGGIASAIEAVIARAEECGAK